MIITKNSDNSKVVHSSNEPLVYYRFFNQLHCLPSLYLIRQLFVISLVFFVIIVTPPIFAEESGIVIKWHIEGQTSSKETKSSELFSNENFSPTILQPGISTPKYSLEKFVTGNNFAINGILISPESKDGQMINQILANQQETQDENWLHKIQYWDRFGDGYIPLANALLEPVSDQKYVINGIAYDEYPNTNLEYFLLERGYDPDNPDIIPNNVFSPIRYDDARATLVGLGHSESVDLRELSPNYSGLDDASIFQLMIKDMQEQVSEVFNDIKTKSWKQTTIPNQAVNPSLQNPIGDPTYQNTEHVRRLLGENSEQISKLDDSLLQSTILFTIFAFVAVAIIGFIVFKKFTKTPSLEPLLTVTETPIDFVGRTQQILAESLQLIKDDYNKEAHERFGQAIRYYYSHKLEINTEMTTFEILDELERRNIQEYNTIKDWLYLCNMVEFAKQKAHKRKFVKALSEFTKLISE